MSELDVTVIFWSVLIAVTVISAIGIVMEIMVIYRDFKYNHISNDSLEKKLEE